MVNRNLKHDIIVIGASAGGVLALQEVVAFFPESFNASVFIVQHVAADSISYLPLILSRAGHLKAMHPDDGDKMEKGVIYIAPPDRHMLIEDGHILVKKGPKENRFRPSIDALFRSAAYVHSYRVIGVVLTGMLDDGTSGMWTVKRLGGLGIIQKPDDAMYPSMPQSVQQYVDVDYSLPLKQIGPLLVRLVGESEDNKIEPLDALDDKRIKTEIGIAAEINAFSSNILGIGQLTHLTCPECSGSLTMIREGKITRFRCHTGHGYNSDSLLASLREYTEASLWKALKSMEEMIILLKQKADKQGLEGEFALDIAEIRKRAKELQQFIVA